jgi:hypothetical protein
MSDTYPEYQSPLDGDGGPPKGWIERCADAIVKLNGVVKWQYVLVASVLFLIGIAVLLDLPVIHHLTDGSFARGLITFIITVATIGLAFVLVCESFTASDGQFDERFRRAREVLALLMGILGTIVGFYFGSAQQGTAGPPQIAEVKAGDRQLITYVSGGSPPYRYSISSTDPAFKVISDKLSQHGLIVENVAEPFQGGSTLTVTVIDSKNLATTGRITFPAPASSPAATASPTPTPTPTSAPAVSPAPASTSSPVGGGRIDPAAREALRARFDDLIALSEVEPDLTQELDPGRKVVYMIDRYQAKGNGL